MPYRTYYNQLLIIIVSCSTFAAIQTLVPSFKPKKTFPGCVKSFGGFPLDEGNLDNTSGLRYVACVLDKSKRGSSQPWSSIEPLNVEILLKRLKLVMKDYVYSRKDVAHLYRVKRDYLTNYPDETVPEEVSIVRWTHFQPPLVAFSLDARAASGITVDFEKELFRSIMQGSAEQFKMIGTLKGKSLKNGYAIFDMIDRVVKRKQLLLATTGGVAFLENACCNEGTANPIAYFQSELPEMEQLLKRTKHVEYVISQVKCLSKAKILFDPRSTRIIGSAVPDTIISRVIYETFIHYCNFDNEAPIPYDLLNFASKKPEYDRFASIENKITYLKRHGHGYGLTEFYALMRIVNGRNILSRKPDKVIDPLGGMKDMIEFFEDTNSNLVEEKLRELLRATLTDYDPKIAIHEEKPAIRKLNRYLQRATDGMQEEIIRFLNTHGGLNSRHSLKTREFLTNSATWNTSNGIHNMIYNIAKFYPNKILTNSFVVKTPSHWNFSFAHKSYLEREVNDFYKKIASLAAETKDDAFQRYLKTVVGSVSSLTLFAEQIPDFSPVVRDGVDYWSLYDKSTVELLQKYCLLSVLHEYIVVAGDRDFIQMRAEEIRNQGYDDAVQMRIVDGDLAELKTIVGKLLIAMIDRERETKDAVDFDYTGVMERTMGLKYKDKKGITDYLAGLSRDERRVEQALRSHKIGRWNVGLQKSLYQYDKNIYDKELGQWREDGVGALDGVGVLDGVGADEGVGAEDLARAEEAQNAADYDGGDGWEDLNENYMDGVFYEEDAEREDYDEF